MILNWALLLVSAAGGPVPEELTQGQLRAITDRGVVTLQCRPAEASADGKTAAQPDPKLLCTIVDQPAAKVLAAVEAPAAVDGRSLVNPFGPPATATQDGVAASRPKARKGLRSLARRRPYNPNLLVNPFQTR